MMEVKVAGHRLKKMVEREDHRQTGMMEVKVAYHR